jgi:hypothetical protein
MTTARLLAGASEAKGWCEIHVYSMHEATAPSYALKPMRLAA